MLNGDLFGEFRSTNNDFPKGGVAPSRHDLARHNYVERKKKFAAQDRAFDFARYARKTILWLKSGLAMLTASSNQITLQQDGDMDKSLPDTLPRLRSSDRKFHPQPTARQHTNNAMATDGDRPIAC